MPPEHQEGEWCWCKPDLVFDGGDEYGDVWVHHAPWEELPPPWIIVEAINDAMFHGEEE